MNQSSLLHLALITTILCGCSNGKQANDYLSEAREISLDPELRQIGNLTLSDIVESIEYIPLETSDECLIGDISNSLMSENYLLLYCRIARRCYLFSKTGRFVAPIGNLGQGPGEYSYGPQLIQIDEKKDRIVLATTNPNQLLYYDFNGRYVENVPLEHKSNFISYHDGFYLLKATNFAGNILYSYTILNEEFKMTAQEIQPVQFTTNPPGSFAGGGAAFCQYVYDNHVHVRENMLNDTLYRINSDYSFTPKYIVNAGKYGVSLETRSDADLFLQEFRNNRLLILNSMFETKDYALLSYRFTPNLNNTCYYHKKDDKLLYFSSTLGIPNDYDGGLDFWPQYQYKNQLAAYYQANLFEEHLNNSNKTNAKGGVEVMNRFEQMCRRIDPEDNPVMVIVTLK